jgi:hypothetical protein
VVELVLHSTEVLVWQASMAQGSWPALKTPVVAQPLMRPEVVQRPTQVLMELPPKG